MEKRTNCREFFQCDCGNLDNAEDPAKKCPARTAVEFDGVNHGEAGGRICWKIDGTKCRVVFGHKFQKCMHCEFFRKVEEEDRGFVLGLGRK